MSFSSYCRNDNMRENVLFKKHSYNLKSEIKYIRKYLEATEKTPEVTMKFLSYTVQLV